MCWKRRDVEAEPFPERPFGSFSLPTILTVAGENILALVGSGAGPLQRHVRQNLTNLIPLGNVVPSAQQLNIARRQGCASLRPRQIMIKV